jgi:hypothetical protein
LQLLDNAVRVEAFQTAFGQKTAKRSLQELVAIGAIVGKYSVAGFDNLPRHLVLRHTRNWHCSLPEFNTAPSSRTAKGVVRRSRDLAPAFGIPQRYQSSSKSFLSEFRLKPTIWGGGSKTCARQSATGLSGKAPGGHLD